MKRELVFTAYNRPHYLDSSIESWNAVRNLKDWPATFFIEPSSKAEAVSNIARKLKTDVTIVVNETRQGVLVNPWNALNTAFNSGSDFVVIAEDDIIVSQDVLEYFEWASEKYLNNPSILAVNAWTQSGGREDAVFQMHYFSPLVWGVWKDRWFEHLRDTWDFDYSTSNADGSQAGWDGNIWRIMQAKKMNCIQPRQSRSDHIGEHGGTHMVPEFFHTSRGKDFKKIRDHMSYTEI